MSKMWELTFFTWTLGVVWLGFFGGLLLTIRDCHNLREMLEFDLEEMTSQRDMLASYVEDLEDRLTADDKEHLDES